MFKRICIVLPWLFLFFISEAKGQTNKTKATQKEELILTGQITDKEGEPLISAIVRESGTNNGVNTDLDGNFSIKTHKGATLLINYLGYKQRSITVQSSKFIVIRLEADNFALNEVIVTGYSRVNSRMFVGATAKIPTQEFSIAPQADFTTLLEGKAPGLNISAVSSTFGAAPKVNIRGGGSINGSVQPLWVVDGAVIDDIVSLNNEQLSSGDAITLIGSSIAGLNASDIENVEVLKDASATSLYGARGMNGVIVITTKSGKRGDGFRVAYNLSTALRLKPSYSQYDMMNSWETLGIYKEMAEKGFFSMNEALYGRRGGVYTQMYEAISKHQLENTELGRNTFLNNSGRYNTDWFNEIYRLSATQNHTVSLSYGGKNNSTYTSFSYFTDPGETIADQISRFTANFKNTYHFTNQLKATVGIQANTRNQYAPGTFARRKNIEAGAYKRDFDINPFAYALNTPRNLRPYNEKGVYEYYRNDWAPFNIIEEYDQNKMNVKLNDFRVFVEAEWNPIKDLRLQALFNTRSTTTTIAHLIGEESNVVNAYRANGNMIFADTNTYLYHDPNDPFNGPKVAIPLGGIYNENKRTLQSYLGRFSADYARRFDAHYLKAFSFVEVKKTDNDNTHFKGYGIGYNRANSIVTSPYIFDKTLNEGENYFGLQQTFDRGIALSGSLTYSYKNRYILNLVGNYEGSNISGKGARVRWLPTWNIGGKWNIDEEQFFAPAKNVWDYLSMRLSYGLVAKMNAAAINSLAVYNTGLTFRPTIDSREYAIYLKNLENRDLTWEKMYELNLGFDMGFFKDRITSSIDLYQRKSFDLIDLIRTSGIGGEYEKWANFGDMKTLGIDWSITLKALQMKDFEWNTTLNFSFFDQKITRLINTPSTFDLVAGNGRGNLEGRPRGALYSFEFTGLTDRGLPTFYFGDLPNNTGKLYNIAGANFYDVKYNQSYLLFNGPTDPYITTGWNNTFKYKNWQLSLFVSGQFGNKVRIAPTFDPEYGDLNVFTTKYRNRWMFKGDEKHTNIPTIPGSDLISLIGKQHIERAYNTYNYSNLTVADGSFIRMKNISLSYGLPENVCKALHLNTMVINAMVQNSFLIYADSKLNGRDPEFVNAGGVAAPIQKTVSLSFNVTF